MKSLSVTTQTKATEQCFPMVLFVMLYNVTLLFQSVDEILCEQCFPAVLFFVLYEVVPTCEPVDEVLRCDRSNESY